MAETRRRYTTNDGKSDWIVTVGYDDRKLDSAHWFEAKVQVKNERNGDELALPPEIRTYRIGEVEHTFRQYVALDFGGDTEAAIRHFLDTIYRRIYSYIERGH